MGTFTVSEGFVFQPFSNITDWQNPPYMTHDFTAIGAITYSGDAMNGTTLPWAQFSPNIYSQLLVNAQTGVTYPRVGVPLTRFTYHLTGYVTSPGYTPPTNICTGTWSITATNIIVDPIEDIAGGIADCGPWLQCLWPF